MLAVVTDISREKWREEGRTNIDGDSWNKHSNRESVKELSPHIQTRVDPPLLPNPLYTEIRLSLRNDFDSPTSQIYRRC